MKTAMTGISLAGSHLIQTTPLNKSLPAALAMDEAPSCGDTTTVNLDSLNIMEITRAHSLQNRNAEQYNTQRSIHTIKGRM